MGCCGGGGSSWSGYGRRGRQFDYEPIPQKQPQQRFASESPLDILKQRLVKGEIDMDEYERLARVLSS